MGEFVGYQQLLATVKEYVRDGVTGTLFIRTESNRSAMVGFHRGEIVLLSCGMRRGLDAIPELQAIQGGSHRLTQNSVDVGATTLPATSEILARLESASADPAAAPAPSPAGDETDAAPAIAALKALFTEFIGPIGPMVFEDVLGRLGRPRGPSELGQLVEALGAELGGTAEAMRFKQAARQRIG